MYTASNEFQLVGYTDSDWAGNVEDRKSTSRYIFHLGSGAVSWASKKQLIVVLSTGEAEYIAANVAACQAVWLRRILIDLREEQEDGTVIFCDNVSSIALTKNHVFHGRSKHIEIRYHFIRELVENNKIKMAFCRSEHQLSDIFTKTLSKEPFERLRYRLGVQECARTSVLENKEKRRCAGTSADSSRMQIKGKQVCAGAPKILWRCARSFAEC